MITLCGHRGKSVTRCQRHHSSRRPDARVSLAGAKARRGIGVPTSARRRCSPLLEPVCMHGFPGKLAAHVYTCTSELDVYPRSYMHV
jgi:hypothetical protein